MRKQFNNKGIERRRNKQMQITLSTSSILFAAPQGHVNKFCKSHQGWVSTLRYPIFWPGAG